MRRPGRGVLRLSGRTTALGARARRLSLSSAALAVLAVLAGCAAPAEAPTGLPEGVSVEFVQLRSDVAGRQAQVHVSNGGDEPFEVTTVAVSDPRFDGVAERAVPGRTSTVAPGSTVDIRIQLPRMDCAVADGAMTLALRDVEVPLPDPLDVIGPLHERECLAERLGDAAALAFTSFEPSTPGRPATLVLSLDPTGEGSAEVVGIQTTNLLTFAAGAGATTDTYPLGIDITPDSEAVGVALPLIPLRCDPHAVQEDKRGTVFTLEISLEGEGGEIELAAPEDMRGRILTWVADWCGFGG